MVWRITPQQKVNWTPVNITTALWLDAADASTITTVSGAVSQWNDKSGNSKNALQSNASARPMLINNGQNGLFTIGFDGIDDVMDLSLISQTPEQNIFLAGSTANIQVGTRIFLGRTSGGAPACYFAGNNNYRPELYWQSSKAIQGAAVRRPAIFRWNYKFNSLSGGFALTQIDGGTAATSSGFANSGLASWSSITSTLGNQQSAFDAFEIIILGVADTVLCQKIEGYLAHKWGLTANLPAGHPYKVNPPAP